MKCIFLHLDSPLSPAFSGAASRALMSFLALRRLGVEVHIWRPLSETLHVGVQAFESRESALHGELRREAASWTDIFYSRSSADRNWSDLLSRAVWDPLPLAFPESLLLREQFCQAVKALRPDFIWAESGAAGALAARCVSKLPFVYAQTDFHFRVLRLRQVSRPRRRYLSECILGWAARQAELQVIRKAAVITTGSQTEALELKRLGAQNIVLIPTSYQPVELDLMEPGVYSPPRIIHLGSLRTTSNYLGLMAYLEKVQPKLEALQSGRSDRPYQLHIIGDAEGAKPELVGRLNACGARFYGHVDDLSGVLRPYDIAILPYEHDTGTRTKLSLLFNYAQVVVAAGPAVAGSPELRSGENCLILPDLEVFADVLPGLLRDSGTRQRLGNSARQTFEKEFTLDAQLLKFQQALRFLAPHSQEIS